MIRTEAQPKPGFSRAQAGRSQKLKARRTNERALEERGVEARAQGARSQFDNAPVSIQRAFWQAIGAQAEAEREFKRWFYSSEAYPAPPSRSLPREPVCWDESWERRARKARRIELEGESEIGREVEAVKAIPLPDAYLRLTGEEAERMIACPLPGHEDRTPSFQVRAKGWRCWGCGKRGTSIYDLAAELWSEQTSGAGFLRLHRVLRGVLA